MTLIRGTDLKKPTLDESYRLKKLLFFWKENNSRSFSLQLPKNKPWNALLAFQIKESTSLLSSISHTEFG